MPSRCSAYVLVFMVLLPIPLPSQAWMSKQERQSLAVEVKELFHHGFDAYMKYAYPADELMPLTCQGRVRGVTSSRGDIDDALGRFSLTLVDTLDTLVVLGEEESFLRHVELVVNEVKFDRDLVVSVFETNIRVLGGLLGAHAMMQELKQRVKNAGPLSPLRNKSWTRMPIFIGYRNELLDMAIDLGDRLMFAFDTKTGLPYSRINLKRGLCKESLANDATCTACAGTLLLEFGALSRYSGNPKYERAARRAMEALWSRRGKTTSLVGETINITSGSWRRTDAGVGAGIDSYYEYLLKAYIMLDDKVYLDIFNEHYDSVMKHLKHGPFMVTTHMDNPKSISRRHMDSLQMFWPGLQVLKGDLKPAIETYDMYYQLAEKHGLFPEAFTFDLEVHWGNWPLRPEFAESTYFLYRATGDPHYLEAGKKILRNLEKYAKVKCGFAAIKDVKKKTHEDKMDSFLLAETFKYLYLLFVDPEDVEINLDDYVFTTEAHLLPTHLSAMSRNNYAVQLPPFAPLTQKFRLIAQHDYQCPRHHSKAERYVWHMMRRNPIGMCPLYTKNRFKKTKTHRLNKRTGSKLKYKGPKILPAHLDVSKQDHVAYLASLDIFIEEEEGQAKLFFQSDGDAVNKEGLKFIQDLIKLQKANQDKLSRGAIHVDILRDGEKTHSVLGSPAIFGPNLDEEFLVTEGDIIQAHPVDACTNLENEDVENKIILAKRGNCMFIDKVRKAQERGAMAVIIFDNKPSKGLKNTLFSMSGDGTEDVVIPSVFISQEDGTVLSSWLTTDSEVAASFWGSVWDQS
eukprot:m.106193 g.106193  ORF g.106193 m.106193 type:complete len:796 (-) comp13899_c0_seq1:126-2513(-)